MKDYYFHGTGFAEVAMDTIFNLYVIRNFFKYFIAHVTWNKLESYNLFWEQWQKVSKINKIPISCDNNSKTYKN